MRVKMILSAFLMISLMILGMVADQALSEWRARSTTPSSDCDMQPWSVPSVQKISEPSFRPREYVRLRSHPTPTQ